MRKFETNFNALQKSYVPRILSYRFKICRNHIRHYSISLSLCREDWSRGLGSRFLQLGWGWVDSLRNSVQPNHLFHLAPMAYIISKIVETIKHRVSPSVRDLYFWAARSELSITDKTAI